MKSIAIGAIMMGGVVMATVGGFNLGTVGSPPFNYETASIEKRKAFLQSEAESFGKVVKRGLISPSGVGPSMKLGKTMVSDRHRRITYVIRVSGRIAGGHRFQKAKNLFLKKACPRYLKSELAKNRIALVQEFRQKKKNHSMGRIVLSPKACSRHA